MAKNAEPIPEANLQLLRGPTQICSKCGEMKETGLFRPHRKDCKICSSAADRLRNLRCRTSGKCTQCRRAHDGLGVCCSECLEEAKLRYVDREPNCCVACRKPGLLTSTYCEECWLKALAKRFLGSRHRGLELKEILIRQSYRCALSGVLLRLGLNASLDHILPKALGGTNDVTNYRWVHTRVNQLRGNLSDEELYDLCSRLVECLSTRANLLGRDATWTEAYKNGIY